MTHYVAVMLLLVASFLLCTATPTTSSSSHITYFRAVERPEWQLDAPAAATADSSSSPLDAATSDIAASRADASEPLSFLWIFPLRNLDWLEAEVTEIHDPASPRYLKRPTEEFVDAKVGPSAAEKDEVRVWLRGHGIDDSAIADWRHNLKIDTTVGVVESLFNTTMHRYRHTLENRTATVARTDIRVPAVLAPRLMALDGVYKFPHTIYKVHAFRSEPRRATSGGASSSISSNVVEKRMDSGNASHAMHVMQTQETNSQCPANYQEGYFRLLSPSSLATAYNFPLRNTDTTRQSTSAAVAGGFAGTDSSNRNYNEAFSQNDLTHFRTNVGFSASFSAVDYGGNNAANLASNPSGPTTEASLDIDALFQVSPTSTNGFYAVTGRQSGLYTSLAGIYALPSSTRPQTVSYSYSFGLSDYDYIVDDKGVTENTLMLLALAGVTVIASAGDDGTPSSYNTACAAARTVSNAAPSGWRNSVMLPQYPASSRWVLSVAETQFLYNADSTHSYVSQSITSPPECNNCPTDQSDAFLCQSSPLLPETAVSVTNVNADDGTTTGGGFSYVFPQPAWQRAAVSSYLTNCATSSCQLPNSNQFDPTARAYPDVAAFGGYFSIVVNGQQSIVGGTSVSAPIWAGLIARLNEIYLVQHGTTLGHAPPTFYNMSVTQPSTFHDITTGNNICPRDNPTCVTAVNAGRLSSTTCQGFQGLAGWDPVTGLGSPNIGNMISFLQNHAAVVAPTAGMTGIRYASTGGNGATMTSSAAMGLVLSLMLAAVVQLL